MVIYGNLSKVIVLHTVFLLSKHIVKHMEIRSIVQTLLFLSGLLSVSVPQDPYDVQDGNSITIPCIVTGNPMATEVRWKKIENGVTEDIDVLSSGGKYAGSSLITPSLTINNVAKTDSAYYQCTATNVEGTSSSQDIFVNVYGGKFYAY